MVNRGLKMKIGRIMIISLLVLPSLFLVQSSNGDETIYTGKIAIEPYSFYEYVQKDLSINDTMKIWWSTRLHSQVDFILLDSLNNEIVNVSDQSEFLGELQIKRSGEYTFIWYNEKNDIRNVYFDIYINPTYDIPYEIDINIHGSLWGSNLIQGTNISIEYDFSSNSYSNKDIKLLSCEFGYGFIEDPHEWNFLPSGLKIEPDPDIVSYSDIKNIAVDDSVMPGLHWMNGTIIYEVDGVVFEIFIYSNMIFYIWEKDSDADGYTDSEDRFPEDPSEWNDTDNDGWGDNQDRFPDDPSEWNDTDEDGWGDNRDAFPNNSSEWMDSDQDGIGDNSDVYPYDPHAWLLDTDHDGYPDIEDQFPNNQFEWKDSDGDCHGDNGDAFPEDQSEWNDTDEDGVGDNADAFPNDPSASIDSDGDGYPDNWNTGMSETNSTTDLTLDEYPDDPSKWESEEDCCGYQYLWIFILISAIVICSIFSIILIIKRKKSTGNYTPSKKE